MLIVPDTLPPPQDTLIHKEEYFQRIQALLKAQDAVLVTHYYTHADLQELTELTGGKVADSLAMAQFGEAHPASTLVVVGVKFMAETAKILSPHKRVLVPTLEATCSLDLGCPPEEFATFRAQYPERTVVVYANTSAAVKAQADWVVTSSIALEVVRYVDSLEQKILWAPDRYLGRYIEEKTQSDMVLWQGSCIVHEEFKAKDLLNLKKQYPEAAVLVHPESPEGVIAQADVVGSTSALIKAAQTLPNSVLIVATDKGIFYQMHKVAPHKVLIEAPTAGAGATCRSCAHCPWMAMNHLANLESVLLTGAPEIQLPPEMIQEAYLPLNRMIHFHRDYLK